MRCESADNTYVYRFSTATLYNCLLFRNLPQNGSYKDIDVPITLFRYRVLRIQVAEASKVEILLDLAEEFPGEVDLWTEPSVKAGHADLLVSPTHVPLITGILRRHGLPFRIIIHNVQSLIVSESYSRTKRGASTGNFSFAEYHTYDEILSWMKQFAEGNPTLVKLFNLSKSFEGRDLLGLKLGTFGFWKPSVWIDSGMHSREWIAPAVALYIAKNLIKQYRTNSEIKKLLRKFDFYVLPVANPDGYEYSWTDDRLWRKSKSVHPEHLQYMNSDSEDCFGVDPNRNFGYHWGEIGANTNNPCSNVYAGPREFSEPETKAMKEFIKWQVPRLKLYLSFHSYGQIWLGAWGFASHRPKNFMDQRKAASDATKAIFRAEGSRYTFGTIADLMYPASGTSIDYFHSVGVPYAFAVELRPEDDESTYGFLYPSRYIEPTGKEILEGLIAISKHIGKAENL